jgi:hypothetical protein
VGTITPKSPAESNVRGGDRLRNAEAGVKISLEILREFHSASELFREVDHVLVGFGDLGELGFDEPAGFAGDIKVDNAFKRSFGRIVAGFASFDDSAGTAAGKQGLDIDPTAMDSRREASGCDGRATKTRHFSREIPNEFGTLRGVSREYRAEFGVAYRLRSRGVAVKAIFTYLDQVIEVRD